jgi:probable phosphoglycerate mutase
MLRHPQRPFTPPADAVELLVVRHGSAGHDTLDEPPPLVGGHTDVPLTARGHAQARALADRLGDVELACVCVTTLRRTAETAAPVAAAHRMSPVVVPELREVFLGEWEGGEFAERMAAEDPLITEVFRRQRWDLIPGAEPPESLAARVRAGLEVVADAIGPGRTGLAVAHGGTIAEACRQATGSEPFAFINVDNASITRLVRLAGGRWLLIAFNDTAHLEGLAQPAAASAS